MRRIVTTMTAVALAVALLAAPGVRADDGRESPQQSKAFGKSLSQWMKLYFTWALGGDQADHVGNVKFLPIPNGEQIGGSGSAKDPAIFQGHLDVTLDPGTAFVLPVAVWEGWTYDPASGIPDDLPLAPSRFNGTVKLDGRPIEISYFKPVYFHPPIPLPADYSPGVATIYAQGLGFVHEPLSVGTHTLTLVSGMTYPAPDYSYGVKYRNTWTITVSPVLPPDSRPYGKSLGEWGDRWWQWAVSIPANVNPMFDQTGADAARKQSGDVWFLAGTSGGSATRTIRVPAEKALFFPIVNYIYVNTPQFGDPEWSEEREDEVREICKENIDGVTSMDCEIDGQPVQNLNAYRFPTPEDKEFMVYLPKGNIFDVDVATYGHVFGPSVQDGYYLMLTSLCPGKHTIHFSGAIGDSFSLDVTYHITVLRERGDDRDDD